LPILVCHGRKKDIWVRFHQLKDEKGLFLNWVQSLYASGCSIQYASVQTWSQWGAYDWFQVRTSRNPATLKKMLENFEPKTLVPPTVLFNEVLVVNEDEKEASISFRGHDQKGALLVAAHSLFQEGFTIRWAKVHTWGRQIDDVFGVGKVNDLSDRVERLRTQLINPSK
jgi:[protein-PII] uridylyltransferase